MKLYFLASFNYLWGFEWVFWGEVDVQEENSSLVDGSWGSEDSGYPFVDVVAFRPGTGKKEKIEQFVFSQM